MRVKWLRVFFASAVQYLTCLCLMSYPDIWELAHVGLHGAHSLVQQLHLIVIPHEVLSLIKRHNADISYS